MRQAFESQNHTRVIQHYVKKKGKFSKTENWCIAIVMIPSRIRLFDFGYRQAKFSIYVYDSCFSTQFIL